MSDISQGTPQDLGQPSLPPVFTGPKPEAQSAIPSWAAPSNFPPQQSEPAQTTQPPSQPQTQPTASTPQQPSPAQMSQEADQDAQYFPDSLRPQPEQVLLEWTAPNRPFKKRNRQYYTTIAIIVFLISVILLLAGQFLPIAVVIAAGFLAYVLSAVPPEMISNKLTTYGIRNDNQLYMWEEVGRFWYSDKHSQRLLHLEVSRFPKQITLLLGDQREDMVTLVLSQLLIEEKPLPTAFDKAAAWLEEKIPLDTDS